jgi:hypothetical protein
VHIDSSVMGVDEVVRQVEELARARMKNQRP